ncbi:MAG: PDZ domain-containing protein [Planctomycetota bacterium]|nr:MAG: PDZ domain-containing protein [Planctomycetota bacterium]
MLRKTYLLVFLFFSASIFANEALEKAFQLAAQKVKNSVVQLQVEAVPIRPRRSFHFFRTNPRGSGDVRYLARRTVSGLVVDASGYILTDANHLAGKVRRVEVILPSGKRLRAKVLGQDLRFNLALLQVSSSKPLPVPSWGNSQNLKVGNFVLAIGKAYDYRSPSVSWGIVSALDRFSGRCLQTDAPISPANTGGALVNLEGKVVGIPVIMSTRVGVNSGIGFAIPTHIFQKLLPHLKKPGIVKPAFLGVSFSIGQAPQGVKLETVVPNSAAQKAGLKPGDYLLTVNGQKLKSGLDLRKILLNKVAGEEITLTYRRGKETHQIRLKLGQRPRS